MHCTLCLSQREHCDEIKRVLKDDGVLIGADLYARRKLIFRTRSKPFSCNLAGFPLHSKWTSEEYLTISATEYDWTVRKSVVLKASFPLTYTECVKSEV